MQVLVSIIISLIAVEHLFFFWMESIAWESFGRKVFGGSKEFFKTNKSLAANQGLYNGFVATGLIWSFFLVNELSISVRIFFLGFIVVAGIFGAYTVSKKIFWFQAFPAFIAFILILSFS